MSRKSSRSAMASATSLLLGIALAQEGGGGVALAAAPRVGLEEARSRAQAQPDLGYSARTLSPGQLELGRGIQVGIAPGLQLGSIAWMNAFSIYNGQVKWRPIHSEHVSAALSAQAFWVDQDRFDGRWTTQKLHLTLDAIPSLALHSWMRWDEVSFDGVPDLDAMSPMFAGSVDDAFDLLAASSTATEAHAGFMTMSAGALVEIRAGHQRLLVRGGAILGVYGSEESMGAVDGAWEALDLSKRGDGRQAYNVGVAWQAATRHLGVRLGLGWSTLPGAWVTQSFALVLRLGPDADLARARARDLAERKAEEKQRWEASQLASSP